MKKLLCGALSLGLISAVFAAPAALANKAPTKNQNAVHTSNLAGTISYDSSDVTTDVVEGVVSLVVTHTGVNSPIVFANLNLPSNFTWGGDETVTVTSEGALEGDADVPVTGWTASFSGAGLSIRGLSLIDRGDNDSVTEFTISVATGSGITTTQEATGTYGVSSQYRTNPTRKIKAQTWVVSTPGMINLTVNQAITWDDEGAETASSGGSSTYTTGSSVSAVPTSDPIKAGYDFGGWWTGDDGTGTQVTDGSFTPGTPYGAVIFYAKWDAVTTNAVSWDDEGAETASSGGSSTYTTGSSVSAVPTSDPIKAGYDFGGWWTGDDGTGTQVTDGSFTPSTPYGTVTFYAKWTATP